EISVSGEGQGCVLFAVSADYYIKKEKQTLDPFTLDIKSKGKKPPARKRRNAEEEEEETTCDKFTISISAKYNGEDGASNMAIINVRPVSGFVFNKESLEALKEKYDL
ncbi:hypothetical protein, partial [Salmonella sp. s55962]|uniref:hypothetical protein n=1 Tax=Salmonella sp. s55962 TaxID=3159685 RepID=UPI0039803FAC